MLNAKMAQSIMCDKWDKEPFIQELDKKIRKAASDGMTDCSYYVYGQEKINTLGGIDEDGDRYSNDAIADAIKTYLRIKGFCTTVRITDTMININVWWDI